MTHSFPYLEPVCCSTLSPNCCFLTCIQILTMEKSDASLMVVFLWCRRSLSSRCFLQRNLSHFSVCVWLRWVVVAARLLSGCGQWGSSLPVDSGGPLWVWTVGLLSACGQWDSSLPVDSGGCSLAACLGFSLRWSLSFQSTGPRAHGLL